MIGVVAKLTNHSAIYELYHRGLVLWVPHLKQVITIDTTIVIRRYVVCSLPVTDSMLTDKLHIHVYTLSETLLIKDYNTRGK